MRTSRRTVKRPARSIKAKRGHISRIETVFVSSLDTPPSICYVVLFVTFAFPPTYLQYTIVFLVCQLLSFRRKIQRKNKNREMRTASRFFVWFYDRFSIPRLDLACTHRAQASKRFYLQVGRGGRSSSVTIKIGNPRSSAGSP